jgi:hypothetical protein
MVPFPTTTSTGMAAMAEEEKTIMKNAVRNNNSFLFITTPPF